ncbi:MAG TPA: CPBP family glutamic-type intramembrane protease [Gemmatimonadaceae bacterium]
MTDGRQPGPPERRERRSPAPPWLSAAEAVVVYVLLLLYIWWGQARSYAWVVFPLGAVIGSHLLRRETPAALGLRLTNLHRCARAAGPPLFAIALMIVAVGAWYGRADRIASQRAVLIFAGYVPWALFQQWALNGYFTNRFAASVRSPASAAALAGACFAGAHAPNWALMGVTLLAGYLAARLYLAHRNLLVLALAHALLGTMLVMAVPWSIMHGMRTGPAEWRMQQRARHAASESRHDAANRRVEGDSPIQPRRPRVIE